MTRVQSWMITGMAVIALAAVSVFAFDADELMTHYGDSAAMSISNNDQQVNFMLKEYTQAGKDLRLTLDNVNKAAIDERLFYEKQVPGYNAQIKNILAHTDTAVVNAGTVPAQVNKLLEHVTQSADVQNANLVVLENTANTALEEANTVLADPAIHQTLVNAQDTSNAVKDTAITVKASVKDASSDYEQARHGWVYRLWKRVF